MDKSSLCAAAELQNILLRQNDLRRESSHLCSSPSTTVPRDDHPSLQLADLVKLSQGYRPYLVALVSHFLSLLLITFLAVLFAIRLANISANGPCIDTFNQAAIVRDGITRLQVVVLSQVVCKIWLRGFFLLLLGLLSLLVGLSVMVLLAVLGLLAFGSFDFGLIVSQSLTLFLFGGASVLLIVGCSARAADDGGVNSLWNTFRIFHDDNVRDGVSRLDVVVGRELAAKSLHVDKEVSDQTLVNLSIVSKLIKEKVVGMCIPICELSPPKPFSRARGP